IEAWTWAEGVCMTQSIMAPFSKFFSEGDTIDRLLAGYSNIEVSLFNTVHVATGDFDGALKKMFGIRSESKRVDVAEQLGLPEYRRLNLAAEFQEALTVMRHCLNIRNQHAHWVWWDDHSGQLAFANVEALVTYPGEVRDFAHLGAHHVDVALLKAQ